MDDVGLTDSERSFFDRKTETWETKSTATDSELSDDNDAAYLGLLDKYGGDCSDDEYDALEDEDEFVVD